MNGATCPTKAEIITSPDSSLSPRRVAVSVLVFLALSFSRDRSVDNGSKQQLYTYTDALASEKLVASKKHTTTQTQTTSDEPVIQTARQHTHTQDKQKEMECNRFSSRFRGVSNWDDGTNNQMLTRRCFLVINDNFTSTHNIHSLGAPLAITADISHLTTRPCMNLSISAVPPIYTKLQRQPAP